MSPFIVMVLGISVVNGWFLIGEFRGKRIQRRLDSPWFANIAQALAVGFFVSYQVVTQASFDLHQAVVSLAALTLGVSTCLSVGLLSYAAVLTSKFSKAWVKFLDFPYLTLGFGGLVRVINASSHIAYRLEIVDSIGWLCSATL